MSKTALDALYSGYATAIDAADYDAAIAALMKAQALLDTTPDIAHGSGGLANSTRFRSTEIPRLIAECRRLKAETLAASSGAFQQTKVIYARATS